MISSLGYKLFIVFFLTYSKPPPCHNFIMRIREDPRGYHQSEKFRWASSLGPFKRLYFAYAKYRWMDNALKHPRVAMAFTFTGIGLIWAVYEGWRVYTGQSWRSSSIHNPVERRFMYADHVKDSRKVRGVWNNNFCNFKLACWSDLPDCGKDFKQKYFA